MPIRFGYGAAVCAILALLSCPACRAQEDFSSPERTIEFARYLRDEGDFRRAVGEYTRYIEMVQDSRERGIALLEAGDCYQAAKEYAKATEYYQKFIDENPGDPAVDSARYRIAVTITAGGMYSNSLKYLEGWTPRSKDYATHRNLLTGVNYLHLRQWDKARRVLDTEASVDDPESRAAGLKAVAVRGASLKRKNPTTAALLSAVVPGAGKVYAGRTSDGLNSLLNVAIAAKQGYDGFKRDGNNSIRGWLYSALALGFYAGDIYGSAATVKLQNERQERDLLGGISVTVNLPLD